MKLHLQIITPYGIYLEKDVDFLSVVSSTSVLGILPNHSPLISDVLLGEIMIRNDGVEEYFATSGGLLKISKEKTILLLDTIESESQIDIERAENSKKRAQTRLEDFKKGVDIDAARAEASLSRAVNRLKVASRRNP